MAIYTASTVIRDALLLIGAVSHGEDPSGEEANDCLRHLTKMIDTWNSETLAIFVVNRNEHSLSSGVQRYTLGPGGDFDQQRPSWVDHMGIIQQQNAGQPIELPLKILTTAKWKSEVPVKNVTSALPTKVYVDGDWPLRNLDFWPLPSIGNLQISVYWHEDLAPPATLQSQLSMPPAYQEAMTYNLAVRLSPEFAVGALHPVVAGTARDTYEQIQVANQMTHAEELMVDEALAPGEVFDWRTGDPQ